MKSFLTSFLIFMLAMSSVYMQAQDKNSEDSLNMKNWEQICYCSFKGHFHPQEIVNADNNWQLLLAMKNGRTPKQLDSLKIPYTQSQLLLLLSMRLIEQNGKVLTTTIPILNRNETAELRVMSREAAMRIISEIEPECKDLVDFLAKNNRRKNAFTILFSYVLDGRIWGEFEQEKLIDENRIINNLWGGNYWSITPKRTWSCGTNSLSNDKYAVLFNWSEQSDELLDNFYGANFDGLLDFLEDGKTDDSAVIDEFTKYGFFDENKSLTIPVIDESGNNTLFVLSNKITDKLLSGFVKSTDFDAVKSKFNLADDSQTVIVFYHEVMWDILNLLLEKQIIQKPIAFESPEKANLLDIADLCFVIRKE